MGILQKFSDIVSSNVLSLLDKCEDPAKMVDKYLADAVEDLAEVKAETAKVMATVKKSFRLVTETRDQVDKYDGLARKALISGSEDDARVFLSKKAEFITELEKRKSVHAAAEANADKMRQMYNKLTADINNLKDRRDRVHATVSIASAQETVSKMTGKSAVDAIGAFDRMEEKANARLDASEAAMELSESPTDEATALEQKYASGSSNVDSDLAAIKAELGL